MQSSADSPKGPLCQAEFKLPYSRSWVRSPSWVQTETRWHALEFRCRHSHPGLEAPLPQGLPRELSARTIGVEGTCISRG